MTSSPGRRDTNVDTFVGSTRKRLNRHRWWVTAGWAATIGGSVMLTIALSYVITGYRVPPLWYPLILVPTAVVAVIAWRVRSVSRDQAGRYVDDYFGLKDTVRSTRAFVSEGRTGGLYDLQFRSTDERLTGLSPDQLRLRTPARVFLCAGTLLSAALLVGFKADSPAVQEEKAEKAATLQKTEEINKFLQKEVEREEKVAAKNKEEKKHLKTDKLRQWVNELRNTDGKEEALRQYARLEKRIVEQSNRLDTRKQERLLKNVAAELQKSPKAVRRNKLNNICADHRGDML